VEFSSTSLEYDGEKHSIFVDLPSELDTSNIEIKYEYILNGEVLLENGNAVTGVSQAGEYTVNAIFTVNNSNYADIEPMQAKLVIEKKKVASSWFDFSESSPSEISKGESGAFEFIAISHEGVNISACIYKVEAEELTAVIEPTSLTPDENGRAVIELETAELEAGAYACIFTVTVTDENYILSTGSTFLDYRFNFEIVN
jgi:hypothetical protein